MNDARAGELPALELIFKVVMRILLVEDFELLRESIATGLREVGFAVDTAADGENGLWHATTNAVASAPHQIRAYTAAAPPCPRSSHITDSRRTSGRCYPSPANHGRYLRRPVVLAQSSISSQLHMRAWRRWAIGAGNAS